MIQFNLLPDVKKQYIKARQTKRLISSISLIAIAGSLVLTGLTFSVVQFGQKNHINNLTDDIKSKIIEINNIDGIDKILTIQNQLNSLEKLHITKPEASRVFSFLTQITPAQASIGDLNVDFITSTMTISGSADALSTVNKFADTLKFTKYSIQRGDEPSDGTQYPVFQKVVTQLNRDDTESTYTIDAVFDPLIFDNAADVKLIIPDTITTRSVQNRPDVSQNGLFDSESQKSQTPGGQ